jgi:myosin heavy subunit
MRRNKQESPISLFSFQDVIMSVVGIVILITLLLILKLITQNPPSSPAATISAQELQEQIKSLNEELVEIQNEITQQHQTKLESVITPQTKNQIDALLATTKRLNAECVELDKEIQNEKNRTEILKNNLKLRSSLDSESQIKQMKEQLAKLKVENDKLSEQEKKLQETADELTSKNQKLENEIAAATPRQINVTIQKKQDKSAFLCIYDQNGLTILPTDISPSQNFTSQSDFYKWVDSRNNSKEYFVIYFRPSRFGRYKEILDRIKAKGFDVGYQVIGETTNLISNGIKY